MPALVEARDGTWQIEYVEEAKDRPWQLTVRNVRRFDEVFGRGVLNAFCRCFVHVDRLNSVISCMYTSEQHHGSKSLAYARDLHTLVWFTVGTLRELGRAIRYLKSALKKSKRLDPESAPWIKLRNLEARWEQENYRRMRDQVAFHVDTKVIRRGLNQLLEDEHDVTLAEGDGPKQVDSRLTLGFLSLHNGLDLELDGYGEFLRMVVEDHGAAGGAIQEAFIVAARKVA